MQAFLTFKQPLRKSVTNQSAFQVCRGQKDTDLAHALTVKTLGRVKLCWAPPRKEHNWTDTTAAYNQPLGLRLI